MALAKSQQSLKKWTKAKMENKKGKKSLYWKSIYQKKLAKTLSSSKYDATKGGPEDTKKGKQFSKQPKRIAKKVRPHRKAKGGFIARGCGAVMPDRRKVTKIL